MPLSSPTSYNNLTLDSRLKSFTKSKSKAWPHNASYKATPDTLARAGFVFTPDTARKSDRVTCFVCGKTLGGWEPQDDPFKEHAEHSPACSWGLARCSIEALRISPESTELVFPNEESLPSSATLEAARLATFGKFWPHDSVRSHSAKSKHMAKAGFIYTPTQESDDLASCFYCNLGLDGWESTDDPHHEHQRRRPHCAFFSARVSADDEPESQPKGGKGKLSKKAQPEDLDEVEEQPLPPPKPKKGTSTGLKRTTSKSSKAAPPDDPDEVKQEAGDEPRPRGKLRKSQSHGQLQLGRSTLGKSATQPERSQSALGKSVVGRSQSQMGHRTRNGVAEDDDEEEDGDEPPPVPAKSKSKATGKSKKAITEPEPELDDLEPARAKTKTRSTKKPTGEVVDEAELEPAPKAKAKAKVGKTKTKTVPEPEPEPMEVEEEEEEAPPSPPPKAKTKGKAKATGAKGKKGGKKAVEDPIESSTAEMEAESGIEADSAIEVETEPEPAPKKTRAKKTTGTKKAAAKGKKVKTKAGTGEDTESQAEPEPQDVQMQSYSDSEPPVAGTPRPPSRLAGRADDHTPRATAGSNANGKPSTGLPVPSRSTPSPTRLARPGTFGASRGHSQSGSATNTPKAATGSGIARPPSASGIARPPSASGIARPPSASGMLKSPGASGLLRSPGVSGIARPPSATGIPRPGATTPGSAGAARTGIPLRQPSPIRPGVTRPVFGAANKNNINTDVVMASPGRPSGAYGRSTGAPGSPTRPSSKGPPQVQAATTPVPFPRESSPMTPARPANTTMPVPPAPAPVPATKPISKGPVIDMTLAELDAETRALTLEGYVRREMRIQYEALKAECEREIEDFLKAASETRGKIATL
ncbi:Protein bir1 OS=Schizosaccharomyces pombe (strain 972 / ATCC 24843) GN=bir1 PE=1 SV=1 [Rhizoctonia solani AG-1 IB]|uniref:Protein bir1 n=1 Tax=Thanatephorus cucumeris (strain AG1-IB / isolate 7/3/14) TaxID=1108050 RepID=A0A0B7FW05_THACB|nr:Protein bir1 OS=Schizosaccharomyces pombe (strain 972 / ATCC 24843) GN=bir1 PE=1 SV=1 [Rhizoctonia solani AG-1 IB]